MYTNYNTANFQRSRRRREGEKSTEGTLTASSCPFLGQPNKFFITQSKTSTISMFNTSSSHLPKRLWHGLPSDRQHSVQSYYGELSEAYAAVLPSNIIFSFFSERWASNFFGWKVMPHREEKMGRQIGQFGGRHDCLCSSVHQIRGFRTKGKRAQMKRIKHN